MSKTKTFKVFDVLIKLVGAAASVAALIELKRRRDERRDPAEVAAEEVMTEKP